ncbi:Exportin-5 [Lamellibrachia satsuma]|nr:Exportin-5 [Lamellibrachia satsuma]
MDVEAGEMLPKLVAAVEMVLNPLTPHLQRLEAHQACEDFKENSPLCAKCGVLMANVAQSDITRHFGLQLLEHSVKYRWNNMSAEEKLFIKENTLEMLAKGTLDLLSERAHIKDGLSRIMVEMIKREWPQHWATLMQELNAICKLGLTQTELVLLVFLRLDEDVVMFQNFPQQRRREIQQALTNNMAELYSYFMTTLQTSYNVYKQLPSNVEIATANCRVAQAVLCTLSAYVDWISMTYIADNSGLLLQMLCTMLHDDYLQLPAAECLLIITNRKGKVEDRKPLLILFNDDAMSIILTAAIKASEHSAFDETRYLFLKKLCQVLTALGHQLCAIWGTTENVAQPPNFEKYLKAILAFTQHPSQVLGSYTQSLWGMFLRHPQISQDAVLVSFIPEVVKTTTTTLIKVGFPSLDNSPSCAYTKLDFDSDEDFNLFFSKYRAEIAEVLRTATLLSPMVTFEVVTRWLKTQLNKPLDIGGSERGHCNLSSPAFLEWDALTVFLESVMSRLKLTDTPPSVQQDGTRLMKEALLYNTNDPLILSCVLSCISALFIFIEHAPEILPQVLEKIFSTVVFNIEGQTKATRSKAVRNVRRHACSVMIKISKQYPHLLVPAFDQLYSHIKKLSEDPDELSQMEKCTLSESLILISNQHKNFDRQSCFLGEILKPVKDIWLSGEVKEALWSAEKFITYVGLDQAPVEPSSADTCGINRSHIMYCINTIRAILTRSTWPEQKDVAVAGGFALRTLDSGTVVMRNPSTVHLIPMLDSVLALARTTNALWLPGNLQRRHPEFAKAYDLLEVDRQVILGIHPPCVDNTDAPTNRQPLERMQSFLTTIHDNCYHILGNLGQSLGHEFYQAPNLAVLLNSTVLVNLDTVPDYRLRPILRVFMKGYVHWCPKEYFQTALLPVLTVLCPYMLERLMAKWQIIDERYALKTDDSEEDESQEILEEQIIRQLTREYIELIGILFRDKKGIDAQDDTAMDDGEAVTSKDDSISELGQLILMAENVYSCIVLTAFNGLTWHDTPTCHKCIILCWSLIKQVSVTLTWHDTPTCHKCIILCCYWPRERCSQTIWFTCSLLYSMDSSSTVNMTAFYPPLLTLALQMYEHLRPLYPALSQLMLQIPSCAQQPLTAFEERLFATTPQKQLPEKKKKEQFKKLVQAIIGKNVSEAFQRNVHIKNLPPMYRTNRPKMPSVFDMSLAEVGLCSLFSSTAENGD